MSNQNLTFQTVKQTQSEVKMKVFYRSNSVGNWSFQKILQNGSKALIKGSRVHFSLPNISQTIYPGDHCKINCGWVNTQLPQQTIMSGVPNNILIQNGLLAVGNATVTAGKQLYQTIQNNNKFPVRIETQNNKSTLTLLKQQQITLQLGAQELFHVILSVALEILPQLCLII